MARNRIQENGLGVSSYLGLPFRSYLGLPKTMLCAHFPFYIYILYHVLKFSSPQNPLQCTQFPFYIAFYILYYPLHCFFQILFWFAQKNDHMSPSRRNESTGVEDYVGAGTLLDTDVVATTATKVYHQADQL